MIKQFIILKKHLISSSVLLLTAGVFHLILSLLTIPGVLDSCFSLNPVHEMVGGGLVSLLRSCLDEKEESVVYSATQCLASLLYSQVSCLASLLYSQV